MAEPDDERAPESARPRRAAGEARAPARGRGSSRSRTTTTGGPRSRRSARRTRASPTARRPTTPTGSPAGSRPAAARARPPSSTSSTRSGRIQIHARRDVLGDGAVRRAWSASTSATSSASRAPRSRPAAASSRWRRPAGRCWRRACARRPTSSTALEDTELRYRHRELDLIANPETRELFRKRGADDRGDPRVPRLARASSRSRRRSCSRSTAAPWRARSPPTTTRSTATSTCGSRPSST